MGRRKDPAGGQKLMSDDADDDAVQRMRAAEVRLAEMNKLLAEWAACAVEESEPLIERLEAMGYAVRGKPHEEVAEILRHPPARPPVGSSSF